ncbi:MAG: phosphoribosylglycinamide formyltransferase [Pseudomonadales bacterium]
MANKRIAVLISGSGSNLQAVIDHIDSGQISAEIALVISNRADAFGLERARRAGIETALIEHSQFSTREAFDLQLRAAIDASGAELVVLAGFMRILSQAFVEHYSGRMLNIHPSLLPKYKGLHTHQRALDAGDREHGCSVHFVTPELDGGPVALQALVPVNPSDSAEQLQQRVHTREHLAYPSVISWFCSDRLVCRDNRVYLDGELLPAQGFQLAFDAL